MEVIESTPLSNTLWSLKNVKLKFLLRATRFSVWSGSIFRQTHCVALTLLDIVIENHWRLLSNISDSGQTLTM